MKSVKVSFLKTISRKKTLDCFQCSEPFEIEGMKWTKVSLQGQSFMLHQIRKMIGIESFLFLKFKLIIISDDCALCPIFCALKDHQILFWEEYSEYYFSPWRIFIARSSRQTSKEKNSYSSRLPTMVIIEN
jgi:hypothetical protein